MIDMIALSVPHFVIALAIWRLLRRPDLDDDPALPRSDRGQHPRGGGSA